MKLTSHVKSIQKQTYFIFLITQYVPQHSPTLRAQQIQHFMFKYIGCPKGQTPPKLLNE